MKSLSVSIVLYKPNIALFISTLESLIVAADRLSELANFTVLLIVFDNSAKGSTDDIESLIKNKWIKPFHFSKVEKNIGFAKAHNQAVKQSQCEYHLILNPDVILDSLALVHALNYLDEHPQAILVTPYSSTEDGKRQYLCKSYPTIFDLFLRGFAPLWCQKIFSQRLANYELRGQTEALELVSVSIVSGCFMLLRKQSFNAVKGFSEDFFLYFEDFDLSIRLSQRGDLVYLPEVKIIHYGGQAAKKGMRHIFLFVRSMRLFFNKHGWQWF